MKTALFTNFSSEEFIGYWNGKPKKFAPGESLYMPDYLANHFAKHLTNRELIKTGKERSTSPKFPEQEQNFMELFNKAYTPDTTDELGDEVEKKDELDTSIDVANKNRANKPTSNVQDPTQPQIVKSPDFGEDDASDVSAFENQPVEDNQ